MIVGKPYQVGQRRACIGGLHPVAPGARLDPLQGLDIGFARALADALPAALAGFGRLAFGDKEAEGLRGRCRHAVQLGYRTGSASMNALRR